MSKALACDNCGTTLTLDDSGDDEYGESAAWIEIRAGGILFSKPKFRLDACTRVCAHALIDNEALVEAIEDWHEQVAEVARTLRGDDQGGDDG